MMKYIIRWNTGYGDNFEVIEAESMELAERESYESWRDDAESSADYEAMEYTDELAEEHCLDI